MKLLNFPFPETPRAFHNLVDRTESSLWYSVRLSSALQQCKGEPDTGSVCRHYGSYAEDGNEEDKGSHFDWAGRLHVNSAKTALDDGERECTATLRSLTRLKHF